MSVHEVVQSHLECLMQEMLEVDELKVRSNGDIGVSTESGGYTVRVLKRGPNPHIEVYSILLTEIDKDPGLLEKLNDLNAGLSHLRVFWSERRVVAAGELVGTTAEGDGLSCVCDELAHFIDHHAEEIKAVFGGLLLNDREDDE